MALSSQDELAAILQHYNQVVEAVNRREMKRFIDGIRQKWRPPPTDNSEEGEYFGEGYTDEGAFNLCVYQNAFADHDPERQGDLCEAEQLNQILLEPPLDALVDRIPRPLREPLALADLQAKLEARMRASI